MELEDQRGVPWEPGSVAKAVSSKQLRLSMTRVDDLYRHCAWKVPELGPPGYVLTL